MKIIPNLTPYTFVYKVIYLLYFRIRYLYKNKIENIETRVFQNLTSLEQLYLHLNKIQKLDLEMFKGLTKLERL